MNTERAGGGLSQPLVNLSPDSEGNRGIPVIDSQGNKTDLRENEQKFQIKDFLNAITERLPEFLTSAELKVVELRLAGMSGRDIIAELGITSSAVKNRTSLARVRIEEALIYPAGAKRLTDYNDKSLIHAARKGRLEAGQFLDMWYATDEGVWGYKPKVLVKTPVREIVLYDTASLRNMPEGDSPEIFRDWFFRTARIVSNQRLSWRKRRALSQPDDLDTATEIFRVQFRKWMERKNIVLSPAQIRVFELKLMGNENVDIEKKTRWGNNPIKTHTQLARKIIEEKLLSLSGIRRTSSYAGIAKNAGLRGQLDAVWFAGLWYTTDDKVAQYISNQSGRTPGS